MQNTPQTTHRNQPSWRRLIMMFAALSLLAAACSGSEAAQTLDASAVEAIETNDGGVLVKPPDVLEGDAGASSGEPDTNLPPPVEGLADTPIATFELFDGGGGSTADFVGTPTVVNFWASNCPACVAEMPDFEETSQALSGRVDFIGLNVNDVSRNAAVALAEQTGVTYPLAEDIGAQAFRGFGAFVMPTTALLNEQGQVAYVWHGVLTGDELLKLIDEHIAPGSY